MTRRRMADLGRGYPEIFQDEHPHGAGAPARMVVRLDLAHKAAQVLPLALADFRQRLPKLGLQPHAGAPALGKDISIDKPTGRHGRPYTVERQPLGHREVNKTFTRAKILAWHRMFFDVLPKG